VSRHGIFATVAIVAFLTVCVLLRDRLVARTVEWVTTAVSELIWAIVCLLVYWLFFYQP
jgi:hypothetical protein